MPTPLLQGKPLRLDPAVVIEVAPQRLVPASANDFESPWFDFVPVDEQSANFVRSLLRKLRCLRRHLSQKGLTSLTSRLCHPRAIDMPAQQNRRSRAYPKQIRDR